MTTPDLTWPDHGPAIVPNAEHWSYWPTYRKPTLTTLRSLGMIADRGDVTMSFAFTEGDVHADYRVEISQDDLFRLLYNAGLLQRSEAK